MFAAAMTLGPGCGRDADPGHESRLVYGAVVDAEQRDPVLVADHLFTTPSLGYGGEFGWFASELPGLSEDAYDAFYGVAFSLDSPPTPMPLGSTAEVRLTGEVGEDAVLGLSRVGFDRHFEHAVVATSTWSACAYFELCSSESLHALRWEDGVWIHEGAVIYLWSD